MSKITHLYLFVSRLLINFMSRVLLEKLAVAQVSKNSPHFMVPEISWPLHVVVFWFLTRCSGVTGYQTVRRGEDGESMDLPKRWYPTTSLLAVVTLKVTRQESTLPW